jgi:hypothetical protein
MRRFLLALRLSPLLLYAACWGILLRTMRPLMTIQRLSRLSIFWLHPLPVHPETIIRAIIWLDHLAIFGSNQCLIRSLTLYRLLRQSGAEPRLLIGFSQPAQGHAWVEWQGRAIRESAMLLTSYRPLLEMDAHAFVVSAIRTHQ